MILEPQTVGGGLLMIAIILVGFIAMTVKNAPQALVLALVSFACLALQGAGAERVLQHGFMHFADIVVLFTGVAIPAHMIERSGAFRRVLGYAGDWLGEFAFRRPIAVIPALSISLLLATYLLAAAGHNTTSILVATSFAIQLCSPFRIPTRFILSGMLIASNLGGFSTPWGDTPNIIEAKAWSLSTGAFFREILPFNAALLMLLCGAVAYLTHRMARRTGQGVATLSDERLAEVTVGIKQYFVNYRPLDYRLLVVGSFCLIAFIVLQVKFPEYQIAFGAITIAVAVAADRPNHRLSTLQSLGYETYIVFASIFILAGCVENSWIGQTLHAMVAGANAAPWMVACTGYVGTASTEAASWAMATAPSIQPLDPSHRSAWALGAGICAGSSSIITAASAGIILAGESKRFGGDEHAITFGKYLPFGLSFSLFMLGFYVLVLSVMHY